MLIPKAALFDLRDRCDDRRVPNRWETEKASLGKFAAWKAKVDYHAAPACAMPQDKVPAKGGIAWQGKRLLLLWP